MMSRKESGVVVFIKQSVVYLFNANMCHNIENTVTEIYLPKSKPFRVGILHILPDKTDLYDLLIGWIKSRVN